MRSPFPSAPMRSSSRSCSITHIKVHCGPPRWIWNETPTWVLIVTHSPGMRVLTPNGTLPFCGGRIVIRTCSEKSLKTLTKLSTPELDDRGRFILLREQLWSSPMTFDLCDQVNLAGDPDACPRTPHRITTSSDVNRKPQLAPNFIVIDTT